MQNEPAEEVINDEEAEAPIAEKPTAAPTPFVYPKVFETEYGEAINLPLPMSGLEGEIYRLVGTMIELVPGLGPIVGNILSMDLDAGDVSPDDPVVGDLLSLVSVGLKEMPEKILELMSLIAGLTPDQAGEKLTYFGDGIRLIALFVRLQSTRFATSTGRINEDMGMSIPVTLQDAALLARDGALTGETPKDVAPVEQDGGLTGEADS